MSRTALILGLLCLNSFAFASSAVLFSRLPFDARTAAVGGATGALADGVEGFHANPAVLASQKSWEIRAGNLDWLEGSSLRSLSTAFELRPGKIAMGFQLLEFGSGEIAAVGETAAGDAIPTGESFESTERLLRVGFGLGFQMSRDRRLELGVSALIVQRDLVLRREGQLAYDFGLRYGSAHGGFRLAAALQSWGNRLGADRLPLLLRLGGRTVLGSRDFFKASLLAGLDIPLLEGDSPTGNIGLEYPLASYAVLRVGKRFNNDLSSWSAGMGLQGGPRWLGLKVDFAWVPMGSFGGRQVWSLGLLF